MLARWCWLAMVLVFVVIGCSQKDGTPQNERVPQTSSEQNAKEEQGDLAHALPATSPANPPRTDEELAQQLRELLPEAVGFPETDKEANRILAEAMIADRIPRPSDFAATCQAPSMLIMMLPIRPPQLYETHARELDFDRLLPYPSELAGELRRHVGSGYLSMIQADRIQDFTCTVEGEVATGTVTFAVPDLYHGMMHYRAVRATNGKEVQWSFREFRFPVHGWTFQREAGAAKWKWTTIFGEVDLTGEVLPPRHRVTGRLLRDGQPLANAELSFHHETEIVQGAGWATTEQDGTFAIELPPGTYAMIAKSDDSTVIRTDARGNQLLVAEKTLPWELHWQNGTPIEP